MITEWKRTLMKADFPKAIYKSDKGFAQRGEESPWTTGGMIVGKFIASSKGAPWIAQESKQTDMLSLSSSYNV